VLLVIQYVWQETFKNTYRVLYLQQLFHYFVLVFGGFFPFVGPVLAFPQKQNVGGVG